MEKIYQEIEFWYDVSRNITYSENEIFSFDLDEIKNFIPCSIEMWLELDISNNGESCISNIEYKNLEINLDKIKILKSFIQTFDKKTFNHLIDEAIFQYERE